MFELLFGVLDDRWSEQLVVYPKTNKQNQKKKRKVEPATTLVRAPMGRTLLMWTRVAEKVERFKK